MDKFIIGLYGETFGKDGIRVTFETKRVKDFSTLMPIEASADIGERSNADLLQTVGEFAGRLYKGNWTSITITKL